MLIQHTVVISIFLSCILSFCYFDRKEYFILAIFSVIGMLVLVSSFNMITIFVAMELLTLPLYGMIAINNKYEHALEASIKFFIISVFSSGVFLFGLSLLYGATHSLFINEMIADTIHFNSLEMAGLLFVLIGISFKLGVIPFHAWVPDVYSSVSPRVIAFVGGAPKIAALVLYLHIAIAFIPTLAMQWILIVLAIASMIIGNLGAITQKNIKRMLGYSAIAQAGFSLLGIISGTRQGYGAAIFYIIMYSFMFIAAFSIIALSEKLENLKDQQPFVSFIMLITVLAMAGFPPTVGFLAKIIILKSLVDSHYGWLAMLTLIISAVALYYYLCIIKIMYFESKQNLTKLSIDHVSYVVLSIQTMMLILPIFFIYLFNY